MNINPILGNETVFGHKYEIASKALKRLIEVHANLGALMAVENTPSLRSTCTLPEEKAGLVAESDRLEKEIADMCRDATMTAYSIVANPRL